ncbi:hypothetical protein MNBD_GAMMA11-2078 [hydrothermal vent metagenome]|uniref:Lipoprotein n=1 Tax=hydrothermal vent metagenome TaxID=652676 RepID=A0A3B0XK29_9ZZZZ
MNTQRMAIFAILLSFMLSACEQNNSTTSNTPQDSAKPEQLSAEKSLAKSMPVESAIEKNAVQTPLPAGHVPITGQNSVSQKNITQKNITQKNAFSNTFSGEVSETFNASTFTYVQIKTDNGALWAAGPVTVIKKGDQVSFGGQTPMENFHSKSLNRTFEMIYFVNSFSVNGVAGSSPSRETSTSMGSHAAEVK